MKDVAAVAGVSLSTVSRVVNGSPPVAPELADKVQRAVEMLGYRHNHTAGTLRRASGLSASIGLIFEDVCNPFFSAIHRGVEDVARAAPVVTFAGSSDADPERERELIDGVLARRVDGLIIVPTATTTPTCCATSRTGSGSCSSTGRRGSIDADCVLSDNRGGARAAVEHLIAHGHAGSPTSAPRRLYTAAERWPATAPRCTAPGCRRSRLSVEPGDAYAAASELLAGPDAPTALFTGQNLLTVEVLRALHRLGRQHEVALVGFDDILLAGARSSRRSRSSRRTRSGSAAPPRSCCSRGSTATAARHGGSCSRRR